MASYGFKSWFCYSGKLLCLSELHSEIRTRPTSSPGCCSPYSGESRRRGEVGWKLEEEAR